MITWISDTVFELDGTSFRVELFPGPGIWAIMKERFHVEAYAALAAELGPGSNMVELGVRSGASTAFMAVLFKPRCLSAIELKLQASRPFKDFLLQHPDGARIHTHFGCDQADVVKLRATVDADFGNQPLDIVIDDASHLLVPSTASFNVLFPRLRPGGIFVIEDWSWEHFSEQVAGVDMWSDSTSKFALLALKTVLACAHSPEVIASVKLQRGIAVIHRGTAELDPQGFDLDNFLGERGRKLTPLFYPRQS